jgi:hypothetical protein
MGRANIKDRRSIERIYPPEIFAADAAENQKQPGNPVATGVRIHSAPDSAGDFELARAAQHAGEAGAPTFLAPSRPLCAPQDRPGSRPRQTTGKPRSRAGQAFATTAAEARQGYDDFIDDIIRIAQRFGFRQDETPAPDDPRLRGLRQ